MALVAYTRVSTDEQASSGLGLQAQRDAIERAQGTPDATFTDEGFRAATPGGRGSWRLWRA